MFLVPRTTSSIAIGVGVGSMPSRSKTGGAARGVEPRFPATLSRANNPGFPDAPLQTSPENPCRYFSCHRG